jgi:hypothetical protein
MLSLMGWDIVAGTIAGVVFAAIDWHIVAIKQWLREEHRAWCRALEHWGEWTPPLR